MLVDPITSTNAVSLGIQRPLDSFTSPIYQRLAGCLSSSPSSTKSLSNRCVLLLGLTIISALALFAYRYFSKSSTKHPPKPVLQPLAVNEKTQQEVQRAITSKRNPLFSLEQLDEFHGHINTFGRKGSSGASVFSGVSATKSEKESSLSLRVKFIPSDERQNIAIASFHLKRLIDTEDWQFSFASESLDFWKSITWLENNCLLFPSTPNEKSETLKHYLSPLICKGVSSTATGKLQRIETS